MDALTDRFYDVEYAYQVVPWGNLDHSSLDREWIYNLNGDLIVGEAHRPSPMSYIYVDTNFQLVLVGIASGDISGRSAIIGGTSPLELIVISDGNFVVLNFAEAYAAPVVVSSDFDVMAWFLFQEKSSILLVGDNAIALWKNGCFEWKTYDVGLGGLTISKPIGNRMLLRGQVDYFNYGNILVELSNGKIDYPDKC